MTDVSKLTDQELVSHILHGDQESYSEVVERYRDPIFRYLKRFLNNNVQDAEDCSAETFLKVFVNLRSYKPKYKFSSWVYRIAHNEAVNLIRKKSKYYSVQPEKMPELPDDIDFNAPNKLDIEAILNLLKPKDRHIMILFYLEDKSIREISNILKITESNVAVRIKRARDRAKKIIKKYNM